VILEGKSPEAKHSPDRVGENMAKTFLGEERS
jgi:hypothetical protein